jgi:hypothetical protein
MTRRHDAQSEFLFRCYSAPEKYRAKRKAETETGKARSEANSEQRDFHFDPMNAFRHKFD